MGKELIRVIGGVEVTPEQLETAVAPLIQEHVNDQTPHPVYDDLPSGRFVSMLENGMA